MGRRRLSGASRFAASAPAQTTMASCDRGVSSPCSCRRAVRPAPPGCSRCTRRCVSNRAPADCAACLCISVARRPLAAPACGKYKEPASAVSSPSAGSRRRVWAASSASQRVPASASAASAGFSCSWSASLPSSTRLPETYSGSSSHCRHSDCWNCWLRWVSVSSAAIVAVGSPALRRRRPAWRHCHSQRSWAARFPEPGRGKACRPGSVGERSVVERPGTLHGWSRLGPSQPACPKLASSATVPWRS